MAECRLNGAWMRWASNARQCASQSSRPAARATWRCLFVVCLFAVAVVTIFFSPVTVAPRPHHSSRSDVAAPLVVKPAAGPVDDETPGLPEMKRRVDAAQGWFEGHGPRPKHWEIGSPQELCKRIKLHHRFQNIAHGGARIVYFDRMEGHNIAIKISKKTAPPQRQKPVGSFCEFFEKHWITPARMQESTAKECSTESYLELMFLEMLRGAPGVVKLWGAWWSEVPGKKCRDVVLVVQDASSEHTQNRTLGKMINRGWHKERKEGGGGRLGLALLSEFEKSPLIAKLWSRNLVKLFQSFSELGKGFMRDFHPGQFVYNGGDFKVHLVDPPRFYGGPLHALWGNEMNKNLINNITGKKESMFDQERKCSSDADCPPTSKSVLCCCGYAPVPCDDHDKMLRSLSLNHYANGQCTTQRCIASPESNGVCHHHRRTCDVLDFKTHVFDVASRGWLLPLASPYLPGLDAILRKMTVPDKEARPTFTQVLALIDDLGSSSSTHLFRD